MRRCVTTGLLLFLLFGVEVDLGAVPGGIDTGYLGGPASRSTFLVEPISAARSLVRVDPEMAGYVAWARSRFLAAGLSYPEPEVTAHDNMEACRGRVALFTGWEGGGRVATCFDEGHRDRFVRRVLLHELGHAWAHLYLDENGREFFVALRGLDAWAEPAPWSQRGAEHAAEVMAWGLMDVEILVVSVAPNDVASLTVAFRTLTGVDAANPAVAGRNLWIDAMV